jgi:hypothetical protein
MAVYILEMEYTIEADSKEEALDLFAEGEYSDMQTVRVYERRKTPAAIHICYSVKDGRIKYRASDGSTGSEPHVDTELFEKYWTNHYKDSEVTFERLS